MDANGATATEVGLPAAAAAGELGRALIGGAPSGARTPPPRHGGPGPRPLVDCCVPARSPPAPPPAVPGEAPRTPTTPRVVDSGASSGRRLADAMVTEEGYGMIEVGGILFKGGVLVQKTRSSLLFVFPNPFLNKISV